MPIFQTARFRSTGHPSNASAGPAASILRCSAMRLDYQVITEGNLSQLEAFVRRVIEDCQSGRATVEEGAGAIRMPVEAVNDGQWGDVQMWLHTAQDSGELIH
ncbi:MAG: hypothetical protein JF606_21665 [Burkholderiales bacterium]|nr:hypothetical protein [Burkholderiales bacterium]